MEKKWNFYVIVVILETAYNFIQLFVSVFI